MSEASPRPWSLFVHEEQEGGDGEISICAEGEWIATMNLRRSTAKADAALILDAVNALDAVHALSIKLYDPLRKAEAERDRLRDIVRRLVETLEQVYKHADMTEALREVVAEAQREASAALGEGETPTGKGVGR